MTGGVIHLWQEKVDEGVPVREVRNIESTTKDTVEAEDEQIQESSISFQDQAHQNKIPFCEREGHQ